MYRFQPRDKSGPMDIDPSPYDTARLDAFALPSMDVDGPARKRLHSELSTPSSPFRPTPTPGFAPFNSAQSNPAPLLFAVQNANLNTPVKSSQPQYDLHRWYMSERKGNSNGVERNGIEDVEMDSPAKLHPNSPAGPSTSTSTSSASPLQKETNRTRVDGERQDDDDQDQEQEDTPIVKRKYARGAISRTNKKRRAAKERERERDTRSDAEDYGTPVRYSRSNSSRPANGVVKSEHQHHYNLHMSAPALRHSEIPSLLLAYLQFFVNASIVIFCLYIAIQFVLTVRRDVNDRMREYSVEVLQEIAECTNLYLTNRCDPTLRVPAMENPCKAWEACMARDPTMVGRINIIAETFAGVINSFVDPISWKTMSFTLVTLTFLVIITNSALFNLRARTAAPLPSPAQPEHHTQQGSEFWPPHVQAQFMPQLPPQVSQFAAQHTLGGATASGHDVPVPQIGWNDRQEKKKGWW